MNFRFFSGGTWDIQSVKRPWGDRPSIYSHILDNITAGEPGLGEKGEQLPDEEIVVGDNGLRWAAGALDGVFGHHSGNTEGAEIAKKILDSFHKLTKKATDERAGSLYSLLLENSTLSYADHLLDAVIAHGDLDAEKMHAIALWLAKGAADREPIKCAIALLGICHGDDRDLLLTLGRHEEFTLFASVALGNLSDDSELSLWALACLVTGWGRIQIIERLAETKDEQIKAWLLRDGYQNDIMHEYTALICAQTGALSTALLVPEPDEKLLAGAGSILTSLIQGRGGPAQGIDEYKEGPEATELYLTHLQTRELDLRGFICVLTIDAFLKEESGEAQDPALGWLDRGPQILELTNALLSRPGWEQKVRDGLKSEDTSLFWTANEAARLLNLDAWDTYFERVKRGEDLWFFVAQTTDNDRIDRVISLAEETLSLQAIASGPADLLGLGPEFQQHNALDSVLQELPRFPGKGWSLIRAGLQSPTVRNRNMAVTALAAWDRATWPTEAERLLKDAIAQEPNERTRELMVQTIEGTSHDAN